MGKPKNPHTDELIIATYQQHLSAIATAKLLNIGTSTVYRALYRNNIAATGLENYRESAERYPRETQVEIKNLYESGMTTTTLQEKFGGSVESICQAIRRVGGTIRPPQGKRTKITPDQELQICEKYLQGMAIVGIEAIFKCSATVVHQILNKYKVKVRKQKKLKKNGYAITDGGYLLKLVRDDDVMACMRNKRGYVLEHRLVMAQSIGRPLTPDETVHHKDGDRSNNKIENLELRQGKHGKGVVMCCLDCGSSNIGYDKLS